jgi:hypothetical protein
MLERMGFVRVWEGEIVSSDPSDEGPSYVYVRAVGARSTDGAAPGRRAPDGAG